MSRYLEGYAYGDAVPSIEHRRWLDRKHTLEETAGPRWSKMLADLGLAEIIGLKPASGEFAGKGLGRAYLDSLDEAQTLKALAFADWIHVTISPSGAGGFWVEMQ